MTQGAYFEVITAKFVLVVNVDNVKANIWMIYILVFFVMPKVGYIELDIEVLVLVFPKEKSHLLPLLQNVIQIILCSIYPIEVLLAQSIP